VGALGASGTRRCAAARSVAGTAAPQFASELRGMRRGVSNIRSKGMDSSARAASSGPSVPRYSISRTTSSSSPVPPRACSSPVRSHGEFHTPSTIPRAAPSTEPLPFRPAIGPGLWAHAPSNRPRSCPSVDGVDSLLSALSVGASAPTSQQDPEIRAVNGSIKIQIRGTIAAGLPKAPKQDSEIRTRNQAIPVEVGRACPH
jgi:hypothetical protein